MKLLKYIHPAAMGYSADKIYKMDELKDLSIEEIKMFFVPVGDWKFEDLEPKKVIKLKDDEDKTE